MRTRCPVCGTVFRVTTEQLRLKAGKVRCGHCQALFNAFDQLVPDTVAELPSVRSTVVSPSVVEVRQSASAQGFAPSPLPQDMAAPPDGDNESIEPVRGLRTAAADLDSEVVEEATGFTEDEPVVESLPEPEPEPEPPAGVVDERLPAVERLTEPLTVETPEESTLAAREAGLVAARELIDSAGYNRWAAGTLAGSGLGEFDSEPARHPVWPFLVFSLLLAIALAAQLLIHFRVAVVQRYPDAAAMYALADVDVPLPRNIEQVVIDASDLQSDNQRGLFVLQATLRNRAAFPQAWPSLELTLTDTSDAVVSRRVLAPADYLPPAVAQQKSFAANGELAVRLWIEAKGIGAAGYRLYVFYP
ncbi:MAG: DUF3426 domain-containing protein [Rhodocyclales bacterium GT-UBC]|nr:MAG: DUF3426 domain-containing protein [Rhodocyclales bacterium GT-UBC]